MVTYVVGFGQFDEVLHSERIVRVLVRVMDKGKSAILLFNLLLVSHHVQVENCVGVEWLKAFNAADMDSIQKPDVGKEDSHKEPEHHAPVEVWFLGLLPFLLEKILEPLGLTVDSHIVEGEFGCEESLDCVVPVGHQDKG